MMILPGLYLYSGAKSIELFSFTGGRSVNGCGAFLLDFPGYLFYNEWA